MTTDDFKLLAQCEPRNAPPSVEKALLREFRKRKAVRRWSVAAAAIAAGLFAIRIFWTAEPPAPQVQLARISPPATVQPVSRSAAVRHQRHQRHRNRPEVATSFYTLPGSSMLPPLDFGTLVRVELPRSALTLVGLPVNEDRALERVRADVLLGQDGEARAVRFIQ